MPRKTDSSNPADWLFIAESDLDGVRACVNVEVAHSLCLSKLAEILEKIIKAELIRQGWFLVQTHDLVKLNEDLRLRDIAFADELMPLVESLAEKYFTDRYPGFDLDDPDWPALRTQVEQVASILKKVKARVS